MMRFLDEFRDPRLAEEQVQRIRATATACWTLMEVCGGQTHSLVRHGIPEALAGAVELIHGPGCPVCVTPEAAVDRAQELARLPRVIFTTFGDMMRVPAREGTLLDVRRLGGNVQTVLSPLDALHLARQRPDREVVFFAVGFETTVPATALAVLQAEQESVNNFSLLVSHVRVEPALEMLLRQPDCRVQGLLAAGHVCTVVGYDCYERLVANYHVPLVVTGFEPVDLLEGILACVTQLETRSARLENRYTRMVKREGNVTAQQMMSRVFEPCDRAWRGMGILPGGGFRLRACFHSYDAERRFATTLESRSSRALPVIGDPANECRAGDVLVGRIKPLECPAFGRACRPETPLGAPMVSSEGACAAYYHHQPQPPVPASAKESS